MQNRYAADIGDFGKFHLLRTLFNHNRYKLKQIWYMYPDESHNSDGMYINYFDKVKDIDIDLENSFKKLVSGERSVKALEDLNLLSNCEYFSKYVNENGKDRLDFRKEWFLEALRFSKDADFIFVDPDNGIATKIKKEEKDIELLTFDSFSKKVKAGKYIFFDEIEQLYNVGRSVVVYHHLNRSMPHDNQIKIMKEKLEDRFFKVIAIKHKPYSPRVYFFILKDKYIHYFSKNALEKFHKNFSHHWQIFL
jgi:hypothetical protein